MVTNGIGGNSKFLIIPYDLHNLEGIFVPAIPLYSLTFKE